MRVQGVDDELQKLGHFRLELVGGHDESPVVSGGIVACKSTDLGLAQASAEACYLT